MARKPKPPAEPFPPPIPPPPPLTPHEIELNRQITESLQDLVQRAEQRCLDVAVLLAQQAARRQGPLVDHFKELGRRYQDTLNEPPKPALKVVTGGKG